MLIPNPKLFMYTLKSIVFQTKQPFSHRVYWWFKLIARNKDSLFGKHLWKLVSILAKLTKVMFSSLDLRSSSFWNILCILSKCLPSFSPPGVLVKFPFAGLKSSPGTWHLHTESKYLWEYLPLLFPPQWAKPNISHSQTPTSKRERMLVSPHNICTSARITVYWLSHQSLAGTHVQ